MILVDVPEICDAQTASEAIEMTLERGGVLLRSCIDPREFATSVRKHDVDIYGSDLTVVCPENTAKIKRAAAEIDILAELDEAMDEFGLPRFNLLSILQFEFGLTLPPHVDNTFVSEGVTALIPKNHLGDVSLHGDSYFDVTPYEYTNGKVSRKTLSTTGADGFFTEARSTYGRGDILLLRQDIPRLNKKAKVHSAASKQDITDLGDTRDLMSLDHAVVKQ